MYSDICNTSIREEKKKKKKKMPFLELANELLISISNRLRDDTKALRSISRVGNHRLAEIVQPLLLHVVQLDWDGTVQGAQVTESAVSNLTKNKSYAPLVHVLRLSFAGRHEAEHVTPATMTGLASFRNITHLYLSFIGLTEPEKPLHGLECPNSVWPTMHFGRSILDRHR